MPQIYDDLGDCHEHVSLISARTVNAISDLASEVSLQPPSMSTEVGNLTVMSKSYAKVFIA